MSKLHIFRAGRHTAMNGATMEFSDQDVADMAASYEPSRAAAPLVVGHPDIDAPAYGWVTRLHADGPDLFAETEQVEPQFASQVNEGRYRNISVSVYPPGAASNPKPGRWYVKHVGFLGATPPAVLGLRPAQFAAAPDAVTFEFAAQRQTHQHPTLEETNPMQIYDPSTGQLTNHPGPAPTPVQPAQGVAPAPQAAPAPQPQAAPAPEPQAAPAPLSYASPATPPQAAPAPAQPAASPEPRHPTLDGGSFAANALVFAQQQQVLDQRARDLQAREDELKRRNQFLTDAADQSRREGLMNFADGLVQSGQLLPVDRVPMVNFLMAIPESATLNFADAAGQPQQAATVDWFKSWMRRTLGAQVNFGQATPNAPAQVGDAQVLRSAGLPAGTRTDPRSAAIHRQAMAYCQQQGCDPRDPDKLFEAIQLMPAAAQV